MIAHQPSRVLVFNPNTNKSIADSFVPILSKVDLPNIIITYWTCPTGPLIIKTQADLYESASHCIPSLLEIADKYDGFLGACYGDHPVVRLLQSYVGAKPVVGIFDASVHAALQLAGPNSKLGIITTGVPFEVLLAQGVKNLLGSTPNERNKQLQRFGGVAASSIGPSDLGQESSGIAREKITAATTRLLRSGEIDVLCVGGVILAGIKPWIREACETELGPEKGREMKIIDQLVAGAVVLEALLRSKPVVDFSPALR
jgi:Asp/Glu/hydantoin racemase